MSQTLRTLTYEHAVRFFHEGRISAYQWRAFCLAWVWSVPRFSTVLNAGPKQDAFFDACGADALVRRQARAKALWARFCEES